VQVPRRDRPHVVPQGLVTFHRPGRLCGLRVRSHFLVVVFAFYLFGGWWWQLVQDMDLIAVSYSANETGISEEPDGCVCVWSLQNTLQRPESVLQCQVTPLLHPHAHAHEI
jgi:hypothetical protein